MATIKIENLRKQYPNGFMVVQAEVEVVEPHQSLDLVLNMDKIHLFEKGGEEAALF